MSTLLYVAQADSIHTARSAAIFVDRGWDVHIVPSIEYGYLHPAFRNVTVHHVTYTTKNPDATTHGRHLPNPVMRVANALVRHCPPVHVRHLVQVFDRVHPDIISSMDFQSGGYLTLAAKQQMSTFPVWVAANLGSDIYHFQQYHDHRERIKRVLAACDYYACECHRDVLLANNLGLKGDSLPVTPIAGGLRFDTLPATVPPSQRRCIAVKGYHGWSSRALAALDAVERCSADLAGYTVNVYSASPVVVQRVRQMQQTIPTINIVPPTNHAAILDLFGAARVYLGVSVTDGISTSMLEAMAMGAFPIQSNTACADEWFTDGVGGFLVDPNDVDTIAARLSHALCDDNLVDTAARVNRTTLHKIDYDRVANDLHETFQSILR